MVIQYMEYMEDNQIRALEYQRHNFICDDIRMWSWFKVAVMANQ